MYPGIEHAPFNRTKLLIQLSHNVKPQLENASVTSCHLLESIPVPSSKKHSMNPPRRSSRRSTREELFTTPTSKLKFL